MCHTGGPRCEGKAFEDYEKVLKEYSSDPTPENKKALKKAKLDYLCTPSQIKKLRKTNPALAEKLSKRYDALLTGAKAYERLRKENNDRMKVLKRGMEREKFEASKYSKYIEKADIEMNELMSRAGKNDSAAREEIEKLSHVLHNSQERKAEAIARYATLENHRETLNQENKENLTRRKAGKPVNYSSYMPSKFDDYFAKTEEKHFRHDSPGSTFTETKNLNEVLALAQKQRGSLSGDDRERLIRDHGADPDSFKPDKRYIAIETAGTVGSIDASKLPSDTIFAVHQKSEGVAPVLVAEVDFKPTTNIATMVLVDNPNMPGTEKSPTLLLTAFPGVSGKTSSNPELEPYIGQKITMKQARELYGGEEFSVNTILKAT